MNEEEEDCVGCRLLQAEVNNLKRELWLLAKAADTSHDPVFNEGLRRHSMLVRRRVLDNEKDYRGNQ